MIWINHILNNFKNTSLKVVVCMSSHQMRNFCNHLRWVRWKINRSSHGNSSKNSVSAWERKSRWNDCYYKSRKSKQRFSSKYFFKRLSIKLHLVSTWFFFFRSVCILFGCTFGEVLTTDNIRVFSIKWTLQRKEFYKI